MASSLIFGAALFLGSAGPSVAQGLPGGATSLNEVHGDWTVACTTPTGGVSCAISQTQVRGENRQRVLAVELASAGRGKTASGVMVLPFGLKLDAGVMLAIDDKEPLPAARFSTCLPAGCLVPLDFDAAVVTALKAGGALQVEAVANDSGQEVRFSVSLNGFSSALARAAELDGS